MNKEEMEYGVWGQVLVRYMHEEKGRGGGYVERMHLLEKKLMVEDNNENWRVKVF